jgi:hypothetical protein
MGWISSSPRVAFAYIVDALLAQRDGVTTMFARVNDPKLGVKFWKVIYGDNLKIIIVDKGISTTKIAVGYLVVQIHHVFQR